MACMKPGVGELAVLPSIWGRKFDHISLPLRATDHWTDWAGGPGDSKEDMTRIDQKLAKFFSEN